MNSYATLTDFYRDPDLGPQRAGSEEVYWRGRWLDDQGRHSHELIWVRDTGEVIALRMGDADPHVEVLGTLGGGLDDVRAALAGYEREMGRPGSLSWARLRVHVRMQAEPPRVVAGRDW